jgi:uncharacterized protein
MRRMKKIEAVSKLKDHAEAIRAMGATALYLFGSTTRDETKESSDLDLFIKQFLEDELEIPVDVTTRDACIRCCGMTSSKPPCACSDGAKDWAYPSSYYLGSCPR